MRLQKVCWRCCLGETACPPPIISPLPLQNCVAAHYWKTLSVQMLVVLLVVHLVVHLAVHLVVHLVVAN